MSDVLDRLVAEPVPAAERVVPSRPVADRPAVMAIAALSVGAAAIHVAMAPPHAGDSMALGIGFLAAAWAQLAVAGFAWTRPGRAVWRAALALNGILLATWAVSRTAGLPFGDHAGHAESVNVVDLTCVAFEIGIVVLALRFLARRGGTTRIAGRALAVGVPVLALAAASVALASPDARSHAHDGHVASGGHDHGEGAMAEDTKGLGQFMNGHQHEAVNVTLDPATQAALDAQLDVTREAAVAYRTVQDASAAGYRRAGPYIPGLGLHYIRFTADELNADGVMDEENLRHPLGLIYSTDEPGATLAGFMYYAATAVEPIGFHGRNDSWHYHENLCAVYAADGIDFPYGPDHAATKAQCDAVGGNLIPQSQWMVHVWTVPGYDEVEAGTFAEENPALACSDGTYYMVDVDEWVDHPRNVCVSGAAGSPS